MQKDQASRVSRIHPGEFREMNGLNLSSIRPEMLLSFHFASIVALRAAQLPASPGARPHYQLRCHALRRSPDVDPLFQAGRLSASREWSSEIRAANSHSRLSPQGLQRSVTSSNNCGFRLGIK
jgi:hypothetical protein